MEVLCSLCQTDGQEGFSAMSLSPTKSMSLYLHISVSPTKFSFQYKISES